MGKGLPTRAGCSTTGNVRLNVIRAERENSGQTKLSQAFLSTFFGSLLKRTPAPRSQGKSSLRKEQVSQTWVSGASRTDVGSSPSSAPDFLCDLQVLRTPRPGLQFCHLWNVHSVLTPKALPWLPLTGPAGPQTSVCHTSGGFEEEALLRTPTSWLDAINRGSRFSH